MTLSLINDGLINSKILSSILYGIMPKRSQLRVGVDIPAFENMNLRRAEFCKEHLEGASFKGSRLDNANFSRANLRFANFTKAVLINADVCYADLECAILKEADLQEADLTGSNLKWANISNADFSYTNLTNTSLLCAFCKDTKFEGATFNRNTILPFSYEEAIERGMIFLDPEENNLQYIHSKYLKNFARAL